MKVIKYLIIDVSALFFLYGCSTYSDKTEYSMNSTAKDIMLLKQQIIETGDTSAYDDLAIQLLDFKYGTEELLAYSFIMANKYDYPQAYFDIFDCLTLPYLPNISQIDSRTAELAIEHLLLAAEKGHKQAEEIVESYSITENRYDYVEELCSIFNNKSVE